MKTTNETAAARATRLAYKTADAYSVDRYGSWSALCTLLINRGHSDAEIEAILRSKWTRWAADAATDGRRAKCAASDLARFIDKRGARTMFRDDADYRRQVAELVSETF